MSCGTCPTSAQPTTRADGTAPTPRTLLWSANIGAWYRQQRERAGRPVVTGTVAAPVPPTSAGRPATPQEQYAREILRSGAWPPHNLPQSVALAIAQADNALLYYLRDEGVMRLFLVRDKFVGGVWRDQQGRISFNWSGPYSDAAAAQRQFDDTVATVEGMAERGTVWFHCLRCGRRLRPADGVCVDCRGAP